MADILRIDLNQLQREKFVFQWTLYKVHHGNTRARAKKGPLSRGKKMESTDILIAEHGLIRQALGSLSLARNKLERNGRPQKSFFEKGIDFCRNFADRFHHFKEENLMFGMLALKEECDLDSEMIALRYQHERNRHFIRQMENVLDPYADGDDIATTTLLENLASYISLLKRHIHREDHLFFKMAERGFSDDEDIVLLEHFKIEEQRMGGRAFFEKSRALVREMEAMMEG
jgi:hemerythrin-like domain-containing protein